jgi:predicted PurR-regulated permease PerM
MSLAVVPCTLRAARAFVTEHHRHHKAPQGGLFALAAASGDAVVGVAIGLAMQLVFAAVTLVLGIAQVPALIVTLPAIAYIWWSGDYDTFMAIVYSVLIFVSGMADNVLKPLMLGRGVDAPMPVILLGALGGMAAAGILGMFVGATLLALGYQLFMGWVKVRDAAKLVEQAEEKSA